MSVVDEAEIAKFDRLAAEWWDPHGPMAPLHAMQPVRLDYVLDQIAGWGGVDLGARRSLSGLSVLDLGCGAGLMAEPMARLGADVRGVDASEALIEAARRHAGRQGLEIDYRCAAAEDAAGAVAAGAEPPADIVLAIEIVEHVADRAAFLRAAAQAVRPGGLLIATTLNRTAKSFLSAIVAAEHVLRWLPVGSHDWRKFPTPDELADEMTLAGVTVVDRSGFVYAPVSRRWSRDERDLSVNFAITAERTAEPSSSAQAD